MAGAKDFSGSNRVLQPPRGMDTCGVLHVHLQNNQFISRWKLSDEERAEVAKTGDIWLLVHSERHPPVAISGLPMMSAKNSAGEAIPYDPDFGITPETTWKNRFIAKWLFEKLDSGLVENEALVSEARLLAEVAWANRSDDEDPEAVAAVCHNADFADDEVEVEAGSPDSFG